MPKPNPTPPANSNAGGNGKTPTISVSDPFVTEGGNLAYTVTLSSDSNKAITVNYTTANGTAQTADYAAKSGTLTFAPGGSLSQTVLVSTTNDTEDEPNETVLLNLSNANRATIADSSGTGTINDNDEPAPSPLPTLSVSDTSTEEGGDLIYTVTLSKASATPVTVSYDTGTITAQSNDSVASSGILTFAPGGPLTQTVSIRTTNDTADEPDETVRLVIANPVGATLADPLGVGTIIDNDEPVVVPPTQPVISVGDASAEEGDTIRFLITLDRTSTSPVTYNYATSNGTANSADYTPSSGGQIIPAGQLTGTVSVGTRDDTTVEPGDTVLLSLSNVQGATVGDGQGTGTITDDDGTPPADSPSISISSASGMEGTQLDFFVTLSGPTDSPVSYRIRSSDGSATSSGEEPDYFPYDVTSGFLPGGSLTNQHTVYPTGLGGEEGAETFTMSLSEVTGAFIAGGSGTGLIIDNPDLL